MPAASPRSLALLATLAPVAGRAGRLAGLAGAAVGLSSVASAAALAGLVDAIVFPGPAPKPLAPGLALLAGLAVARALASWTSERAGFAAAAAVRRHLFARLLARFSALGPVRLADRRLGELAAVPTEAVDAVAPLWRGWNPAMARAVAAPLAAFALVLPADRIAAAILAAALPLLIWFSILAGKGAEEASGRQWASLARLGGHLLDQIRGLPELKLAGTADRALASVKAAAESYGRETMSVLRLAFLSALVLEFVATGAIAGVAVAVGFRLLWGEMDFATGFLVLVLAPEFFAPLRDIGVRRHGRIEALAALDRIADVLDGDVSTAPPGVAPAPTAAPAIRFEGVRLVHADGRVALDRLDLDVAAGEKIALIGPSGAGKSTVLALLAGFLEPTEGRILIDGRPLAEIDRRAWRRALVHLPQTPAFFEGSIADNVVMDRPAPEGDAAAALARALRSAGIDDVVARLPRGAATPLAEAGRSLSGGEARRIALARAFWAAGPLVLVDEPTAHLDAASEARILDALADLAVGRTMVVVAHRPATLAGVDRVVVLEAGRLARIASPATILAERRAPEEAADA
ncbi:MAG: thiol reductant ABC exporter subunit CydD [Hyphomicrobiales bacterium]|nr:thiol reductant ABC exporter subunit CydD [Hyphomicrobiales bacterium]